MLQFNNHVFKENLNNFQENVFGKIFEIPILLNTVKEAKNAITEYITFYNQKRMHQSLEYLTPEQVYLTKSIG